MESLILGAQIHDDIRKMWNPTSLENPAGYRAACRRIDALYDRKSPANVIKLADSKFVRLITNYSDRTQDMPNAFYDSDYDGALTHIRTILGLSNYNHYQHIMDVNGILGVKRSGDLRQKDLDELLETLYAELSIFSAPHEGGTPYEPTAVLGVFTRPEYKLDPGLPEGLVASLRETVNSAREGLLEEGVGIGVSSHNQPPLFTLFRLDADDHPDAAYGYGKSLSYRGNRNKN